MKLCFYTIAWLLCSAAFSLRAADGLFSDYAEEETPETISTQPADGENAASEQWQIRFADACALSMSDSVKNQAEAKKIIYSLLDERPEAIEPLRLLVFTSRFDSNAKVEIGKNMVALAKKHPESRLLNAFVLSRAMHALSEDDLPEVLKNSLNAYARTPLMEKEDLILQRGLVLTLFVSCTYAFGQDDLELARAIDRCREANTLRRENLTSLTQLIKALFPIVSDPLFEYSPVKMEITLLYKDVVNAYLANVLTEDQESRTVDARIQSYRLCAELVQLGQAPGFVEELKKNLEKNPENTQKTELLAFLYERQKQYKNAIALFQNYYKHAGKVTAYNCSAYLRLLRREKKYDDILKAMDEYLPRLPQKKQREIRLSQAGAFLDDYDFSRAADSLNTLNTMEVFVPRMELLFRVKRLTDAYMLLKNEIAPLFLSGARHKDPEKNRLFLDMATILCNVKPDFELEEKLFTAWLNEYPADDLVLNNLAYQYAVKNIKIDQAFKMVNTALKARPDNGAYLDTMAWVLYRQKKYRDAAVWIEKAIASFGGKECDSEEVLDHAGDIYFALGDKVKAAQYWQRALDVLKTRSGNFEVSSAIRKKLDSLKEKKDK